STVARETRERVLSAARTMGFHPSAIAPSLATRHRGAIGLIFPAPLDFVMNDPFLAATTGAVAHRASVVGYHLLMIHAGEMGDNEDAYLPVLVNHEVDGVLVLGFHADSRVATQLQTGWQPYVLLDFPEEPWPGVSYVDCDNEDGGFQAARHLIELGHRAIGLVDGPADSIAVKRRRAGFLRGLAAYGLKLAKEFTVAGDFTEASGYHAGQELLERARRPTALFVVNDRMAFGVISAARACGVRVPEDLSIAGFDDIDLAQFATPPLTTVRQDARQMGELATDLLLALIAGESPEQREIILPVSLVVRGSTARLGVAAGEEVPIG
ncbi:MAG: LacI family transcriptional regulator, partial [Chloroflexi bacterium]|nr:LacI family transcriptional regulator [Chloroflexota bacterium]